MSGQDCKGSTYANIDEMWEVELYNKQSVNKVVDRVGSEENWYKKANEYWAKSELSYNGVLGGYANLSGIDIKFSLSFILTIVKLNPKFRRDSVLDCGAGIGRISKQLLCQTFKNIDLIDQCEQLIDKAKEILKEKKNVRHYYAIGLQQFQFSERYDCVWIQWVFSHLSDEDAVKFLRRAQKALNADGYIIIKQNHCKYGFVVDKDDCSVTRSSELFRQLFLKAGLTIVKESPQEGWPQDLFEVHMYALC